MNRLLRVTLLLLLIPAIAFGQAQTTGRIVGTVVDEAGTPIQGASVIASSYEFELEREATTDKKGEFLLGVLPVGNYSVAITAAGLQPQVYSLRVGIGDAIPIKATLAPGEAIAEEIEVYGTATAFETTATSESFDYKRTVEELPLPFRNVEDVALLAPNMSPNGPHTNSTGDPSGAGYSVAGSMTSDVVVLLDGAEVSDPYFGSAPVLFLEDAVEELQVMTSGISARYGRFSGGVINAVTKSGGNRYEGTVRAELENQDWNSQTPFGETQVDDVQQTFQATVGGYVLKDRLWFFAGGRTIPETGTSNTTGATSQAFTTTDNEDRYQLKLRGAPASDHLVDVSHLDYERDRSGRAGLPAGDLGAIGNRLDTRTSDTLAYQGVLDADTFLEVQATRKEAAINSGGDAARGTPILDISRFQVFNNHWWDFDDTGVRDNETAAAAVTRIFDSERWGSHSLEGGVQYVASTTGGENRQSSTGFNVLALNADFFAGQGAGGASSFNLRNGAALRWRALPLGGDQEIENTSVYAQDTIDVGKWRFDLGLRWEQYDGTGPLPIFDLDFDQLAPRLGVAYDIAPDWQIGATWGVYVSRFNDNIGNNVTGVSSAPRIEQIYIGPDLVGVNGSAIDAVVGDEANWGTILDFVSPDQPTSFLADNIQAPFAEDLTLSLSHALANNRGSLTVTYVNREYRDLLDDFVGDVCDFGLSFGQPCPAGNFTSVVDPDGNAAVVDTTVWTNTSLAKRDYEALSLQWEIRPTSRWGISGNYTFSENQANYEGEARNQPSSGSQIGDYVRSRPEQNAAPFGLTDEDVTHRGQLWGSYRFDLGRDSNLVLASILSYQSGASYSLTAQVPLANDPSYIGDQTTYTHFFDGRGQNRFNDFWSLDLAARYDLPVWNRLGAWVKLTAVNALNNDQLIAFDTTGGSSTVNGLLVFAPAGNCGLGDAPSTSCTGFGRIRNQNDYQRPREIYATLGLRF